MTSSGNLKIGDLNVSKLMKGGLLKTQIGTPYYMSPEIWRNRPYDQKSDMWSVGCVIYELCAQRPPFQGKDIEDLSRHVQARQCDAAAILAFALSDFVSLLLPADAPPRPHAVQT
jgi:NIMA (never in mitosis gene a)-related kinase